MSTTSTSMSTELATLRPVFTDSGRLALAGYLAGYRGLTREACTLDLRQFTNWCRHRPVSLFAVRRADIETYARDLEAKGRPAHAQGRVHHRGAGCRGAAAGRAGGSLPCRPAHHDAV